MCDFDGWKDDGIFVVMLNVVFYFNYILMIDVVFGNIFPDFYFFKILRGY